MTPPPFKFEIGQRVRVQENPYTWIIEMIDENIPPQYFLTRRVGRQWFSYWESESDLEPLAPEAVEGE